MVKNINWIIFILIFNYFWYYKEHKPIKNLYWYYNKENLNYASYQNNVGKTLKTNDSALANRPLVSLDNNNINSVKSKENPIASDDLHKSGNIQVNTKYNENNSTILPISIKPGKGNDFVVLENDLSNVDDDVMGYSKSDNMITNMPLPKLKEDKKENKQGYKMDLSTQFYIGSLTVVGLFVFYRLIQKTR